MKNSISRKEFIKLSTMTTLALPVLGYTACSGKKETPIETQAPTEVATPSVVYSDRLGMQVFGVRQMLEKDLQGVFKALAEIGIKNIELFDPATLKTYVPIIKDLGMTPLSTHFLPGYISGKWDTVKKIGMTPPQNYNFQNIVDDCVANGVKYLGIAIMMPEERQSMDDFKKFADLANKHGEISKQAGVQLYYHNHSFEFKPTGGLIPFDEMLKIFDPELVKIELDAFWVTIANNDPIQWINKLGNQLLFIHMKDLKAGTPTDYTVFEVDHAVFLEIGDGVIDFKKVLEAAKAAGVQYAFLDQDHTAMDKLESVRKSYGYLKGLGI
jgi:sugar phosphate isomerase/epimerase